MKQTIGYYLITLLSGKVRKFALWFFNYLTVRCILIEFFRNCGVSYFRTKPIALHSVLFFASLCLGFRGSASDECN